MRSGEIARMVLASPRPVMPSQTTERPADFYPLIRVSVSGVGTNLTAGLGAGSHRRAKSAAGAFMPLGPLLAPPFMAG